MNSYITKPTVAGIVAILCWSVTIAFAKSSSDSIGPITTSAIINLLGSLGGIIYLLIRNRSIITNTTKAYSFICGLLFIYYMLAIFMAVGSTKSVVDAGTIGLINYLWIPLTIVFSVIFNKVPYKKTLYLGLVVSLFGVFMSSPYSLSLQELASSGNLFPAYWAVSAAIAWALYNVFANKLGNDSEGSVTVFMFGSGVVTSLLLLVINERRDWSTQTLLELGFMALATNIGYFMWDYSMRKGNAAFVSLLSYFIPITSTIVTVVYLHVVTTLYLFIGAFLVVAGAYITHLSINNDRKAS